MVPQSWPAFANHRSADSLLRYALDKDLLMDVPRTMRGQHLLIVSENVPYPLPRRYTEITLTKRGYDEADTSMHHGNTLFGRDSSLAGSTLGPQAQAATGE